MNNFYSKIDKGTEFIDKSGTKYTFKKYRPSGRYNNKNQKEVWIYTYEMEKKKPIETISIKELATSVNKKINGVISYKSKSGSYYIDLPMDDIKIRISDHYILSRDSLNPKSSNDIDYVRKDFTKSDIQELIDEIEEYKKDSFKKGGKVDTYKDKYNRKYKFKKGQSNSLKEIAETTGIGMKGIQQIYNKGIGAYKTNPSSVRPNVKSKEQWAYARVYSAVMGGKASKIDKNELKMEKGGEIYNAHIITNDNNMRTTTEKYYSKEHKEVGTYAKGGKTNTKNMKPKNQTKKGREIKITKINDIANLKEEIELGNVTYRGLGMGKLFDRFYEIANENGTRIKVKGQEYYITETEFDKISRGSDGKLKIKFDAPKRNYAKGGKVKKFPISVQRRVDEINAMLPKVLDSDNYPSTYAGSTVEGYVVLEKPIEIKNQYVYINADKIKDNYPFEKRYNVNDRDNYASYNGRQALMYDLGIIKRAFTKLLKNDSSYAEGGEVDVFSTPIEQVAPNVHIATKKDNKTYLTKGLKGEMYEVVSVALNEKDRKSYKFNKGTKVMVLGSVFQPKNKRGKDRFNYSKGGEIETWREGDEVMVLMRGTKASGYQKAIITGIDKENGILTETDNPETLLAVYSKEEKLSDEIFAREIKSFPSPATKKEEYIDPITQSHIDYEKEKSERLYNSDSWVDAQRNAEGFAKGGVIYKHKHIPTMTFEITGETKNGYKGIQKDKKSLSRLEKTKGKSASYSSSELKDLFNKETFAKGGSLEAHALEVGDEILGFDFGEAYVIKKGVVFIVDLKNGTRRKTKLSKQDAVSTFAKGGMTNNLILTLWT